MVVFTYDKTFEGLLTALFEAYYYKIFPDLLWAEQEPLPLFYDRVIPVYTDEEKSKRVWQGLQKKTKPGRLVFPDDYLAVRVSGCRYVALPLYAEKYRLSPIHRTQFRRSRRFENLPNLEKSKPGKTPAVTIHPFSKNGRRYIFRRF